MKNPTELKYSKSHEWVKMVDDTTALIGITDYAQNALGDIVFINLPESGDSVESESVFGDTESVKAVSDLMSPVTGTVTKFNEELLDSPEKINEDAYAAWLIEVSDISAFEELMNAEEYESFVASL